MTRRGDRDGDRPRAAPGTRPRNYLAPADRHRLFWSVMPVAAMVLLGLGWIERTWWSRPAAPGAEDVDTRLTAVAGPGLGGEEVVIEADAVPLDAPPAAALSASRESLARVRDATFFRAADEDAWFQTWKSLREAGLAGLQRAAPPRVSFRELFAQPRSFRGRLVRMRGTLHRLEQVSAPANTYAIERYWQGWLEPEGGPSSPVVVQALSLPEGMATGLAIDEPVEVVGAFFKNYAYAATDTIRVAPLIMTVEPIRRVRAAAAAGGGAGSTLVTGLLAGTLLALIGVSWWGMRGGRRPRPSPPPVGDLDTMVGSWDASPIPEGRSERED